jgi:dipeptidase E
MGIYYLFSNFDMERGFTMEVADELRKDVKEAECLVFIASNPDSCLVTDSYAKKIMKWFEMIGITFRTYRIIDYRISKKKMSEAIEQASAIFLMGGDTLLQYQFIKENELAAKLQEYSGCIMGLSAGGINMAKTSVCSKAAGHESTEIYSGLNLVDITISPHFDRKSQDALDELLLISYNHEIYAMCDGAAIICRGEHNTFLGEIYLLYQNNLLEV